MRVKGVVAALVAVLGFVSVSSAALLGVPPTDFPLLTYDNQGTTGYDAGTGLLSIGATPIAILFSPSGPPSFVNPTGIPPARAVLIAVQVDQTGVLTGGVAGDDLVVTGEVQGPAGLLSGTLLTGEAVAFGFQDVEGQVTDSYDFLFRVTGGLLAPFYLGKEIGVTVTSEGSSFTGSFAQNFGGGAKGVIFPTLNANAGPDQVVTEGDMVRLDGSASTGEGLTFSWLQVAGPVAGLNDPSSMTPTFTAPLLPRVLGNQTLTFQLTVSSAGGTGSDSVDITVKNVNHAPVAEAGGDQTVKAGSQVTLSGAASFDLDGDPLTYQWVQTAGAAVTLIGTDSPGVTFTAPQTVLGTLTFVLTVSDGELSGSAEAHVLVERDNHPPVADAGPPQTVNSGTLVTLDGRASSDPDGNSLTFLWTQVPGSTVGLANAATATPSFTAPAVSSPTDLVFRLTVNDGLLASVPADVVITVVRPNFPPRCEKAHAKPRHIWPPNHRMVEIGIRGVTDENNDTLSIWINGVTQDEPVDGLGDGDTSPDAVVEGGMLLLRAERSGTGNGRVYRIHFTATDPWGGMCTGSVMVGVPHSKKSSQSIIDDGQFYDSTRP